MIKGLLLDFYGTVVEEDDEIVAGICARVAANTPTPAIAAAPVTAADVGAAWWAAFQAATAGPPFRRMRDIATDALAQVIAELGADADAERLCAGQVAYWRTAPLRPGARDFLARLDLPACVVSDIDRDDLDAVISHHELAFTATVTSEDAGAYKPAAEMFRRGLAALGLRADEVLHVGDSLAADVAGAHAAGIRVAWINRRGTPVPDGLPAVHTLDGLADLAAVLR